MTHDATLEGGCPFCAIVRGESPARLVLDTPEVLAFFPLEPAVIGHVPRCTQAAYRERVGP